MNELGQTQNLREAISLSIKWAKNSRPVNAVQMDSPEQGAHLHSGDVKRWAGGSLSICTGLAQFTYQSLCSGGHFSPVDYYCQ